MNTRSKPLASRSRQLPATRFDRPRIARRRLAVAGFTLLEALIALAISGFGLIAVARLQIGLQAESDLAKQLSEATFLGQRRIEELRAFQQLTAATGAQVAAGAWGYNNIASGSQSVVGTNATYTVTWTISDATASVPYKNGLVTVQWTDRKGAAQVATLSTMIGGSDPASSLGLTVPPAGTPIRKPKNRDLNVPVPAVDIGNGTSYFTPPGAASTVKIIFSNTTGRVTKTCVGAGADWTAWTCTNVDAYLVSGFISVNSSNLTLNSPIDVTIAPTEGASNSLLRRQRAGDQDLPRLHHLHLHHGRQRSRYEPRHALALVGAQRHHRNFDRHRRTRTTRSAATAPTTTAAAASATPSTRPATRT